MNKRTLQDIHRVLSAVEKGWEHNPHLSLYAFLKKMKPESSDQLRDERLMREINRRYP